MNGFDFSSMARSLLLGAPHQSLPWRAEINNKGEMDALYRLVRSLLLCFTNLQHTPFMEIQMPDLLLPGLMPCPRLQVEQLSRDLHRQQGVTISMAHNKG